METEPFQHEAIDQQVAEQKPVKTANLLVKRRQGPDTGRGPHAGPLQRRNDDHPFGLAPENARDGPLEIDDIFALPQFFLQRRVQS